jgi:hypothetical protein
MDREAFNPGLIIRAILYRHLWHTVLLPLWLRG